MTAHPDCIETLPIDAAILAMEAHEAAPALIGCSVFTVVDGVRTGGIIAETEAYDEDDAAAHCHPDATPMRRNRSASMRLAGGHVYVHHDRGMSCLNLVCGPAGFGSAVLIRAIFPTAGLAAMRSRRSAHPGADRNIREGNPGHERLLCNGPCKLGEALGLHRQMDGLPLSSPSFEISRPPEDMPALLNGTRINISKDAHRLWRWGHPDFVPYLSQPFRKPS